MEYNVPTKVGTEFSLRKIPSPQGRHTLIIIVAMKLIALLFLFNLQVTASVYSQRISLTASNTPLRDVLQSVRKQSGYSFFVESDNLRDSKPVNLNLWDNSVPEALDKIFENQPFTYTIQNNVIVVTRKERTNLSGADFLTFDSGAPDSTKVVYVQGSVRDDKGQPLVGVSVRVKGSGTGTVTKPDGTYTLKTNAAATLIFSYIGYLSREIKAQQGEIDVVLKQLNTALDQVQVIAYGTTTKRFSTANVVTINSDILEKQPVSNPLLAIAGRVPGMFIQQTTGLSAGNINVAIQGQNSLMKGLDPFYVIDGVPYTPQNLSPTLMGEAIVGLGGSTLGYINPNDIESISILKDADATAIYGSRAANGAILITTKKGKPGLTKVNLNLQNGWGKVPKRLNMLSTAEYLALRREGKKNDSAIVSPTDYDLNGTWDTTTNHNWQKELIGGTAQFSNLQASVSGGSVTTQFIAGGGFLRETTVYPGNFGDYKINFHTNVSHQSTNQKFRINFSATYLNDLNKMMTSDLTNDAISLPPNAPSLYNTDGTLNWGLIPGTNKYTFNNPLRKLSKKYTGNTNNLIGNIDIGYNLIKDLEFKVSLGYNRLQTDENAIVPQTYYLPSSPFNGRISTTSNKSIASWSIEPQLKYKRDFNWGKIDFLLGTSFQQTKLYALSIVGRGFTNDAQLENIQSAPNISINNSLQSTYRYNAVLSRLNYNYDGKYILTLSGRRDGSSRFGSANRFANFYSVSGAWIFSSENYIKDKFHFLTFGKIRASYGTTGNDQIGDYQYLTLYNNTIANIPYQQTVGLQPSGLPNPYLQWEITKKLNFGLDLGILHDQIILTANYYINRSSNQLLSYPLGFTTGFSGITKNIDAVIQNRGLELQLEASPIKRRNLFWTSSFNITIAKNKLIKFEGLESSPLSQYFVLGEPVNIVQVFHLLGVDPQTGLYTYQTSDGKTTSNPDYLTDRIQKINTNPQWYGGFSNTIGYKGFTLDFTLQFVKQTGLSDKISLTGSPGAMLNFPTVVDDRWRSVGDRATYQKAGMPNLSYFALLNSGALYEDASFIRLRNASISYDLPTKWAKKAKISSAKIFVRGQNLFTISKYFGTDPETQRIYVLPVLRMISVGANLNL